MKKIYKVDVDLIEKRLRKAEISPEQFGLDLGMTGEGFRLILKNGRTKPSTIKAIADKLGVHPYEICKQMPQPLQFTSGGANDAFKELLSHERTITKLKQHIIELYKFIGKDLTKEEVDELNRQ